MMLVSQTFQWSRVRSSNCDFIEFLIDKQLRLWEGTPYGLGQRRQGVAVDCVNFCTGFLDAMIRRDSPTEIEALRGDRCLTRHGGTRQAMRAILRSYQPNVRITTSWVEPGDIAVTGPIGGGPGHVLVAGVRSNTWFHATRDSGVVMAGSSYPEGMSPFKIYRYLDKERWA